MINLLFLIPWQLKNLFTLGKLLCSPFDSGNGSLLPREGLHTIIFLNKKMSDKDFIKDVVSSWSIFSNRKRQHSSGSSKMWNWQKHSVTKNKLKFRNFCAVQSCGKTKTKSWNSIFNFIEKNGKGKRTLEFRFPKNETGNLNSVYPCCRKMVGTKVHALFFLCEILCKVWSCTSKKFSLFILLRITQNQTFLL